MGSWNAIEAGDVTVTMRQDGQTRSDHVERLRSRSTPTLYEAAGGGVALPMEIKPVHPSFSVCGPALTVLVSPGDNLWIHRAVTRAAEGDVLVVETGKGFEAGYWGEVLSRAGIARRIGGVVIDGCVRDGERLGELGLSVFARGRCINGTTKDDGRTGCVGRVIRIGSVSVATGDFIVGDGDGVVALPSSRVSDILSAAERRDAVEDQIFRRIAASETTVSIYDLGER